MRRKESSSEDEDDALNSQSNSNVGVPKSSEASKRGRDDGQKETTSRTSSKKPRQSSKIDTAQTQSEPTLLDRGEILLKFRGRSSPAGMAAMRRSERRATSGERKEPNKPDSSNEKASKNRKKVSFAGQAAIRRMASRGQCQLSTIDEQIEKEVPANSENRDNGSGFQEVLNNRARKFWDVIRKAVSRISRNFQSFPDCDSTNDNADAGDRGEWRREWRRESAIR